MTNATTRSAAGGRSVIVTGAGQGLGHAIAAAASDEGWTVGVLDRAAAAATAVASTLPGAVPLVADVTDVESIESALDAFADATTVPAPDGLVCNAGIVRFGPLLDHDVAEWRRVVDVNLTGTFVTATAVARRMIAAERAGSIVTITSMNGVAPGPNAGAYGAAKAGAARLTQQMALEWGPTGIRVNAVAPGLIDAGMSQAIYADAEIRRRRSAAVPLGRLGTGADVAAAVMFLLSDASTYITGTELLVDGGVTNSIIANLPRPRSVDSVGPTEGVE